MIISFLSALVFSFFPAYAQQQVYKIAPAGSVRANIVSKVQKAFEEKYNVKIEYTIPEGASTEDALKSVDSGEAEAGGSGADWPGVEQIAKEKNLKIDLKAYTHQLFGLDRIPMMVNKGNTVKKLSDVQISEILSGKIDNWKKLDGADAAIHLILTEKLQATNKVMQKRFLKGKDFSKKAKWVAAIPDIQKEIENDPHAIAFGAMGYVTAGMAVPEHPVIGRPLTFFSKGQPSKISTELLKFVRSEEGKKLIGN